MSARSLPLAVLLILIGACSDTYGMGSTSSCTASATQICLRGTAFSPTQATVAVGTTVTFKNADGVTHTTTSSSVPAGGPTWNTSLAAGATSTVQLTVAGTYDYYCTIHGTPTTGMHARIVVQ